VDEAERLRRAVLESLDQPDDAKALARHAYRSRTQFYRVFRTMMEETPVAMRRRLLLERAAWQLSRTQLPVTDISLDANYGSLEAFTRAFRKAFGISPSLYRRMGATHTRLHATNGRLLDLAKTLTNDQLDRPLKNRIHVFPWDGPDQSLRQLLDRMVQTKEAWAAAMTGGSAPLFDTAPPEDRTAAAMLARLENADRAFHSVLSDVRNRSAWEDAFVDALCEPPETFTFGGMFAHIITFNAYRRMVAIDVLRGLGVNVDGVGCPMEYLESLASAKRG
jgi:AraC-like DNA-binding protein